MNKEKPKIFISHSWEDNEISRKLAEYLRQDGADVWIDFINVKAGDSFVKKMNEGLEKCDTVILIWSQYASRSTYVKAEWMCALAGNKTIIPCIIDDTKLPILLSAHVYADFREFEIGFKQLAQALGIEIEKNKLSVFRFTTNRIKYKILDRIGEMRAIYVIIPIAIVISLLFSYLISLVQLNKIPPFRTNGKSISDKDVKIMLISCDFFESNMNRKSKGFNNKFRYKNLSGDPVIIDEATGLMWQQGGSLNRMNYDEAIEYFLWINEKSYAENKSWRIPTLEEAMSLMEHERNSDNLYIDTVFNHNQNIIWTIDITKNKKKNNWVVDFSLGRIYYADTKFSPGYFIRLVRSIQ